MVAKSVPEAKSEHLMRFMDASLKTSARFISSFGRDLLDAADVPLFLLSLGC